MITAKQLSDIINIVAPYELTMEGDNCGIVLDMGNAAGKILFALDTTPETITEASEKDCGIIVSHHPAAFLPKRNFSAYDAVISAAQKGISLISAHTCYDAAPGGVNDVLCELIGITDIVPFCGIGRGGNITPMECGDFVRQIANVLGCDGAKAVKAAREIRRVAVIGGSGGEYIGEAIEQGYDAFVTGEAKHHEGIEARNAGICLVAAGHFATENPSIRPLRDLVKQQLGDKAECILSETCADPFDFF